MLVLVAKKKPEVYTMAESGIAYSALNAVFTRTGYAVISAKTASAAIKAIESRRIDAVIVGHSMSRSLQEKITASAKDKRLPVVVLHLQPNSDPIRLADANLCGIDGAALITEVLRGLIAKGATS